MFKSAIFPALRIFIVLAVITGVIYPLAVTLVAQVLFPLQANGSLITADDRIIGSELIGQNYNDDPNYFWGRPSATGYNPLPSGGSNQGPTNAALQQAIAEREQAFREANGVAPAIPIPPEMVTASASGLDPHISPESARLQIDRIAEARGIEREQIADLVNANIEAPQLGIFGEPRVNVLRLNLALDQLQ